MENVSLARLLESLEEMLVLSYRYENDSKVYTLVTERPERSEGSDRDFIRVVFSGVNEYTWFPGGHGNFSRHSERYQLGYTTGDCILQIAQLTGIEEDYRVHLGFGGDRGAAHFQCREISTLQRGSIVRRSASGEFLYFTMEGKPMDFADPFGA